MSTFKLIALPLIALIFSLASATTTYASNPMIVNESVPSVLMSHGVQITAPVNPNIRYLTNVPMTIGALADNSAGDLRKLTLIVNGQVVAAGANPSLTATYMPTTAGQYTLVAIASYTDTSTVQDVMTFNVSTGGIRQVLIPIQVIIP